MVRRHATVVMLFGLLAATADGAPTKGGKAGKAGAPKVPAATPGAATPAAATPAAGGSAAAAEPAAVEEGGGGAALSGVGSTKTTERIRPSMSFDRISYEQGLPNSYVYAITQDKRGFIWLGTANGLARYDGARMVSYKHDELNPKSLPAATVTALALDKDGKLWVGTDGGPCLYDPDTNEFTRYSLAEKGAKDTGPIAVTAILRDAKDRMWFATGAGGLTRFDVATKSFVTIATKPLDVLFTAIAVDAKGNLWLGTQASGIVRYNPDDGSSEQFRPTDTQGIPRSQITSVLAAKSGLIWVGSFGEGLVSIDPSGKQLKLSIYRHEADDPTSITDDHVLALFEDKSKAIWVGSLSGLSKLDEKGNATQYTHDSNDPLSMPFPEVDSIYQDASGLMWIGGFTVGAAKFEESRAHFGRQRTASNPANSFWEDADGSLWVGTYHGEFYHYDYAAKTVTIYTALGTGDGALPFAQTWVTSLHRDKKGTLWIATQSLGLIALDTKNDTFKRYTPEEGNASGLPVDGVWWIDEDDAGLLWLGTDGGGLVKFDPAKDEMVTMTTRDKVGLTSDTIYVLYRDPTAKAILWLGTGKGGLIKFDTMAMNGTAFRHKLDDPSSLSSDDVYCIYRDPAGALWVGTQNGGFDKVDAQSGKAVRYTTTNSKLTNETVWGLLADADGNLWMTTNGGGLVEFDPKNNKFFAYDVPDGVQGIEFGQGAFMKNAAGKLFVGGVDGFNVFDPKQITRDTYVPPVALTGFTLFNRDAKLPKPIWDLDKISVTYSDTFELQFAAQSYAAPQRTHYAYKLEGVNDKWIETDRPYASYQKLNGGSYTLKVKAANRHGVWNETGVTLKISVKPPFWRTWPAYLVYLLLLVGAVFLVTYLQRQRVRRVMRDGRLAVVERDLALTGAVQNGFLPEYNEIAGGHVQLFGFYRPADSCSGDWWWHEALGTRHVVLCGDVTGHGPGPAMVTAAVASAFRLLVTETGIPDLLDALLVLNRVVLQVAKGKYSMTMAAFELDESTGQWLLYNAGAPPMMTLNARGKHRVHFAAGTPLGTDAGFEAGRVEGRFQPGERVMLYTDGIPEIMLPSGQALGMRRLGQMFERTRQQQLRDSAAAIVQQADLTQSGKPQEDDWTFTIVEWGGGNAGGSAAAANDLGEYQ